ncbi:hypothetical protein [Agrobacterium vitis]|uniref:Uncharacterized protein n=1 Tax=Agrobacterium vitis TaxID=373 RepID=A0A7K1RJN9_AGRVI|nr:hypothetical protein [Agrobacterium vitis]MVA58233.1 hypothetical protein [Agrobacterium vitis]
MIQQMVQVLVFMVGFMTRPRFLVNGFLRLLVGHCRFLRLDEKFLLYPIDKRTLQP